MQVGAVQVKSTVGIMIVLLFVMAAGILFSLTMEALLS